MKFKDTCFLEGKLWHPRQHIKNRDITYRQRSVSHLVKGSSSQSYGFSNSHVYMWELDHKESSALKNWCFELWCWRRLLRVPWTARRSNQSILKEVSPGCSLEGMMLKLTPIIWVHVFHEHEVYCNYVQGTRWSSGAWDGKEKIKTLRSL